MFSNQNLGINKLEKWDIAFVTEKLKKSSLELDELELKKYFSLDNVILGLFKILNKLYGLSFNINNKIEENAKSVRAYEVYDQIIILNLCYIWIYIQEQVKEVEHG